MKTRDMEKADVKSARRKSGTSERTVHPFLTDVTSLAHFSPDRLGGKVPNRALASITSLTPTGMVPLYMVTVIEVRRDNPSTSALLSKMEQVIPFTHREFRTAPAQVFVELFLRREGTHLILDPIDMSLDLLDLVLIRRL